MFKFLLGVALGAGGLWAWNAFGRDLLGMGPIDQGTYGSYTDTPASTTYGGSTSGGGYGSTSSSGSGSTGSTPSYGSTGSSGSGSTGSTPSYGSTGSSGSASTGSTPSYG
ncbi:MAG: hypothetical protein JO023_28815, partial [Chloroflexi bacterium]|nr:hypothetical protein [Chloroflexota bacterium]